jgi:hypothetical protein
MTKTKSYQYGRHTMKTYFKPAGHGFEVGLTCEGQHYFMGNFVHRAEAVRWWGFLNRELVTFAKRNWISPDMNFSWYCKFLSKHMYSCYYSFLDKLFVKHNRTYQKAYVKEMRKYNKLKRNFDKTDKLYFYNKTNSKAA